MTTIFTVLADILKYKKGDLSKESEFDNIVRSPYMFQRWVSMTTPFNSFLINETTNKLYEGLDNELLYKLLLVLIEKNVNYQKTNYLKRPSEKIDENMVQVIDILRQKNELSQREVENYLELEKELNYDVERHKKYINKV